MSQRSGAASASVPAELRPWIEPADEMLVHIRPSPWAVLLESLGGVLLLVAGALLVALAGAPFGLIWSTVALWLLAGLLLRLAWQTAVVMCRRYVLTGRYVLGVSGVFRRRAVGLPLGRLQHVLLHRTFLERRTATGTLAFTTAGTGQIDAAWVTINRPLHYLERIRDAMEGSDREGGGTSARPERSPRPLVIGLAGGIGSGKSEVARAFERLGCIVADSDKAAREALRRPEVRARLVEWWGSAVLDDAGEVDRRAVAEIVFDKPDELRRLESVVHPLVRRSRGDLLAEASARGAPAMVIDAPLLFEAGLDADCDAVVFVEAPRRLRLDRVRESRGWDEAELDRREKLQLPLDEKRKRSDHEIVNDADPDRLAAEVRRILDQILACRRGYGPGYTRPDAG